jgi:RTX calcium-binding nonapeptide repeat (4 copies)
MNITSQPKWSFRTFAAVVPIAAALLVPAGASASGGQAHGVRAELENGTLAVDGGNQANSVALRLKQGDATRIQVDVGDNGSADFSFARGNVNAINVTMGNGRDSVRVDDSNGAFTDTIPTTIAGGNGDDSLNGGQGVETFRGGNGDDVIDGGRGNDRADLGRGDDTFVWDPGEGSDTIEGQSGSDTMVFNGAGIGAGANEDVTMSANGGRLIFFRQPGNVTMDTDDVEIVDFNALDGTDNVTVNDLTGTDVTQTNLDLAKELGGSAADGKADNVIVNGTNGADTIHIDRNGSGADVTGLATAVSVKHADSADRLSVNTLAGADTVLPAGAAGLLQVLVNGSLL